MNKTVITLLIGALVMPHATSAMDIDGVLAFFHRDKKQPNVERSNNKNKADRDQLPLEIREHTNENTNADSNTNTADSNTNSDANVNAAIEAQRLAEMKVRVSALINTLLSRVNSIRTQVESNDQIRSELQAILLSDLTQDAAFLQSQQSKLTQASTRAQVRTVAQEIREYMVTRRARIGERQENFSATVKTQLTETQHTGERMVQRLEQLSTSLNERGINTTELDSLIATHRSTIEGLDELDVAQNPDGIREQTEALRSQIQNIVSTIKNLVK